MPRKIRQLISDLERANFVFRAGRGSHRKYKHPSGVSATISGGLGDDAKDYQEKHVQLKIQESLNNEGK